MNGESILNHKANMCVIVLVSTFFFFKKKILSFLSQIMALFGWGNIPSITLASGFYIPILFIQCWRKGKTPAAF